MKLYKAYLSDETRSYEHTEITGDGYLIEVEEGETIEWNFKSMIEDYYADLGKNIIFKGDNFDIYAKDIESGEEEFLFYGDSIEFEEVTEYRKVDCGYME